MSKPTTNDYVIRQLRDAILDNDLAIVNLVNKRLTLVAQLRAYKESQGIDFLDADREAWMHRYHQSANRGPLSSSGLTELLAHVLELTKAETRAPGQSLGA